MKKTPLDYLAPESEVLEMHSSQSIMTTSFTSKELNEDNSDKDLQLWLQFHVTRK